MADDEFYAKLRMGFDHFERYDRRVHRICYLIGVLLFLTTYVVASRFITGSASSVIPTATIVAGSVTGVYFMVLFYAGIGTPLGNLIAPTLIAIGTPYVLYRILLPVSVSGVENVELVGRYGGLLGNAVALPMGVTVVLLGIIYNFLIDPEPWEDKVMPNSFSLAFIFENQGFGDLRAPHLWDTFESPFFWKLFGVMFAGVLGTMVAMAVLESVVDVGLRSTDFGGTVFVAVCYFALLRTE